MTEDQVLHIVTLVHQAEDELEQKLFKGEISSYDDRDIAAKVITLLS